MSTWKCSHGIQPWPTDITVRDMQIFEIWSEGYDVPECKSGAKKLGQAEAETFQEACNIFCSSLHWQERNGFYDSKRLTIWGCRLFDNEIDARRSFG